MDCDNRKSGKKCNISGLRVLAGIIARAHMRRAGAVRPALKEKGNVVSKRADSRLARLRPKDTRKANIY